MPLFEQFGSNSSTQTVQLDQFGSNSSTSIVRLQQFDQFESVQPAASSRKAMALIVQHAACQSHNADQTDIEKVLKH